MKSINDENIVGQVNESCRICRLGVAHPRTEQTGRTYLQCDRCRGTFLAFSELPSVTMERETYDQHENDPEDPRYRRFVGHVVEPLMERLPPGACGLDFGSGDGPAGAALLREAGFEIACYDPFYRPDKQILDKTYDFVLCCEVAEHFHRPANEFLRMDGLLRPGGLLGIMTAMEYSHIDFAAWHYRRDPTHVAFYKPDTMLQLAQDYDWQAILPSRNVVIFRKED